MIAYAGVKTGFCVRFTERLKLTVLTGECAIATGFTKKVTTSTTVLQSAIDELLGLCVSVKTTKGGWRLALLQAALSNEEIFLKRKDSSFFYRGTKDKTDDSCNNKAKLCPFQPEWRLQSIGKCFSHKHMRMMGLYRSTMEMLGNVQYPSPVEVLSISGDFTVIGIRKQAARADAITAVKVLMGSNIHSCQVAFFVHVVTVAALYGNLLDSYVSCIGRYYFTPYCRRCSG